MLPAAGAEKTKAVQRVVLIRGDGTSFFLEGDPFKTESLSRYNRKALPHLLELGWKIAAIHMVEHPQPGPNSVLALVVMEK